MPIKPIDHLVMPNRSLEASTQQTAKQLQSQQNQENMFMEHSKEIKHNSEQAIKSNKSENHEYRFDAKEKGNNQYQNKKRKKKKPSKDEKDSEMKGQIHSIDIRI